ncbi:MAG: ComF family protein [Oscillospiraceae bacterium]|nr:ComF family protein [Oscillospiraceae bacterium]
MSIWNRLWKKSKSFLCCGCRERFTDENAVYVYKSTCICRKCFEELDFVEGVILFFGEAFEDYTFAPFYYRGLFREIFLKFKFNGNYAFGHILGMAAAERLKQEEELKDYNCIVPVPLSDKRYRERGFNQSEIMAQYIAKELGIKMEKLLVRCKHTAPQSSIKTADRSANVRDAFKVCDDVKGKRIILFDDIHTTGSTMHECRVVLEAAGAEEVCLVSSAFVYHKKKEWI